ncbi:MAG: sugar phosphate isomerase/epimerase [Endomicrobiia bacterium]|nr:sugar phosphate isomerase/epimerase [Endomicrobiia bacterium]
MKIGISTGLFFTRNILEALPEIKEAGFDVVEIWAGTEKYGSFTHFNWHKDRQTQSLDVCLRGLGIAVESLHSPFSELVDISSPDENLRTFAVEEIERSMYCLKRLGGRILVVHPASTDESLKDDISIRFSQCRKSLEHLYVRAQDLDVKIAIETQLPHIFGGEISVLMRLVEGFSPEACGFCFDSSHANLYRKGAISTFDELALRIISLHISDNKGSADDHLVPGAGMINWRDLVYRIKKSGCCEVFMLEVLKGHTDDEPRDILVSSRRAALHLLHNERSK